MGYSTIERINLLTKAQLAGVIDSASAGQWYESKFPQRFIVDPESVWMEIQTLRDNPCGTLGAAQAFVSANPTIVQDYSTSGSAVRLTAVPGLSGSTYVAYSTYCDTSSSVLSNWVLPQIAPQANGNPSIGFAVRLFDGGPEGVGTEVLTTDGATGSGTSTSVAWIFNYGTGMLLLADDFRSTISDPWIQGFRYIGKTASDSVLSATVREYLTHTKNLYGNPMSVLDLVNGTNTALGPIPVVDVDGNLVYVER